MGTVLSSVVLTNGMLGRVTHANTVETRQNRSQRQILLLVQLGTALFYNGHYVS